MGPRSWVSDMSDNDPSCMRSEDEHYYDTIRCPKCGKLCSIGEGFYNGNGWVSRYYSAIDASEEHVWHSNYPHDACKGVVPHKQKMWIQMLKWLIGRK